MISILDGINRDGTKFQHANQNSLQFKTCELFISGIFHLIFSDHGWLQLTEATETQTTDKGGLRERQFLICKAVINNSSYSQQSCWEMNEFLVIIKLPGQRLLTQREVVKTEWT